MTKHRADKPSKPAYEHHPHHRDPVEAAVQTSRDWLARIAGDLDTDVVAAMRALRAWLHVVRDRTSVENAAHLGAQLPELIRGMFYEGWVPSRVPVTHEATALITDFSRIAAVAPHEVSTVAGVVTQALSELFSPGQLRAVFATLPEHLRQILDGQESLEDLADEGVILVDVGHPRKRDRLEELDKRISALTEALAVLAKGLEELPTGLATGPRGADAAQEAHRILLREGMVTESVGYFFPSSPTGGATEN